MLFRSKGLASLCLRIMMKFIRKIKPEIKNFIAKINMNNKPSIKLFEKLGYKKTKEIEIFK